MTEEPSRITAVTIHLDDGTCITLSEPTGDGEPQALIQQKLAMPPIGVGLLDMTVDASGRQFHCTLEGVFKRVERSVSPDLPGDKEPA